MWDFLNHLLAQGGTTAVLFVVSIFAHVAVIRHLLRRLNEAQAELRECNKTARAELSRLQDRRVEEAQSITRSVLEHMERIRRSTDQIRSAMDTLRDVMAGRR